MSTTRLAIAAATALLVLLPTVVTGADQEIACRELLRQRITVTVMGSDGSNPTIIFENDKFVRGSTMPKWSPGGEWIAFRRVTSDYEVGGIYKIRPSGEEMTQILCVVGTAADNVAFERPYFPQWSPDGEWILLFLHRPEGDPGAEFWLGVVPADDTPEDCHSNLVPLYAPEVDPVTGDGWSIVYYAPTWTDDGSKVAFFEEYEIEGSPSNYRLQVLDIETSGEVPAVVDNHPIDLPEDLQQVMIGTGVDWQRGGGNILLFDTNDGIDKIAWLDLDLETYQILDWGHLTDGWSANWSPNNNRIVYNVDLELKVAEIRYGGDGAPMILDSSVIYPDRNVGCLWPDWKRDALQVACTDSSDCDDDNPCTDNVCNGGVCQNPDNTASCDDENPCTDADVCSNGSCNGTAIDNGSGGSCTLCCAGECWDPMNSCEPEPVDCVSSYFDKKSCNADPLCHWDNRAKECLPF